MGVVDDRWTVDGRVGGRIKGQQGTRKRQEVRSVVRTFGAVKESSRRALGSSSLGMMDVDGGEGCGGGRGSLSLLPFPRLAALGLPSRRPSRRPSPLATPCSPVSPPQACSLRQSSPRPRPSAAGSSSTTTSVRRRALVPRFLPYVADRTDASPSPSQPRPTSTLRPRSRSTTAPSMPTSSSPASSACPYYLPRWREHRPAGLGTTHRTRWLTIASLSPAPTSRAASTRSRSSRELTPSPR